SKSNLGACGRSLKWSAQRRASSSPTVTCGLTGTAAGAGAGSGACATGGGALGGGGLGRLCEQPVAVAAARGARCKRFMTVLSSRPCLDLEDGRVARLFTNRGRNAVETCAAGGG